MDKKQIIELSEKILAAWNVQNVEQVLSCYTEDCIYRDPNVRGSIIGHEALGRYLDKLFKKWKMHWSTREFFSFADEQGCGFLWHAQLTPASGGKTTEIDGMDLALVRAGKLCRNEVYYDRTAFFGEMTFLKKSLLYVCSKI